MRKSFFILFASILIFEVQSVQAQSSASNSTNKKIEQAPAKKSILSWLMFWKSDNSSENTADDITKNVGYDYSKMDLEELNFRFIEAAIDGDIDALAKILRYGANINTRNTQDRTALIEVARLGNVKTAKWLIDRGASVNYKDMYDGNALIYATKNGKREMVNLLIQSGARKEIDL